MTRYLVAAASRRTIAAACDYLDRKLAEERDDDPAAGPDACRSELERSELERFDEL